MNRVALLLTVVLLAPSAQAVEVDFSELGLTRDQVDALNWQLNAPGTAPAIAFGSPVGFGAGWGSVYAGVGGQTLPATAKNDVDGSMAVGFGLLDPARYVGLDVAVSVISLTNAFGDDGNFGAKLHRAIGSHGSLAIGVENAGAWGNAKRLSESYYAAYTHVFSLGTPGYVLTANVGVGNERFVDPGDDGVGAFGGVALVLRRVSVVADWSGRDLGAALSVVPFQRLPVALTVGFVNLTERYNIDAEFAGGLGWSQSF